MYQFIPVTSGELNFKVRAKNDAHVALTNGPTETDPMYEVSYMMVYLWGRNDSFVSVQSFALFYLQLCVYLHLI